MEAPSSAVLSEMDLASADGKASSSSNRCPELHTAAWEGNLVVIEQKLNDGENPNLGDEWNLTPIMSTLMRHSLQDTRCIFQARKAVQRNLVIDCREEDAEQIAKTAAVLNLFLRFGADPDTRSNGEKTALHYATSDGLYEAAKILLSAGAAVDSQDSDGQSPLLCAVQERSLLVTNLLVSQGASIDLQDKSGVSPLSLVIQKGYVDMMQIFLNHYSLVATPERLNFAGDILLQAVEEKSVDIAQFLVESGYVTLDYQNAAGESAMHRAIAKGCTQMMETLCTLDSTGQSLNLRTIRGESCFHFAVRFGSVHELKILLQFQDQVDTTEKDNQINGVDLLRVTPLFAAATNTETNQFDDRHAKMKLLIPHGAMLFRSDVLPGSSIFRHISQDSRFIMCVQVQRCLTQWFEECQDECGADLLSFCTKWVTNVPTQSSTATLMSALNLSICAGYAAEVLPLLLMLPQGCTAITDFLQGLEAFKSSSNGLQFRCLARELGAVWA